MPTPLHPQVAALLAEEAGAPAGDDLDAMRRAHAAVALERGGTREEVASVEAIPVAGRPARLYAPLTEAARPAGLLIWLHGGGWIMGDLDGFDHVCRSLANASGHRVLSVDYRLAPEDPFPAGLDDADAALAWAAGDGAREHGWRPDRIVVGGDSAGGNLAAVLARRHPDVVRAQLLAYPVCDAGQDTASYAAFGDLAILTREAMRRTWEVYLAGHDPLHPDASPARAEDLAGLPPALIVVAGHDVLHDEGVAYARALEAAGVAVELHDFEDMSHSFLRWGGVVDRAGELIVLLGEATRRALA